jgi:hypothetical protein
MSLIMRQLTLLLLIVFSLASCASIKTKSNLDTSQAKPSKQNIISQLQGVWVLTDYINEIKQTKSPLKSANKLKGIVTMIINGSNKNNKIEVTASWNNHEGLNFITYLKEGHSQNTLKTDIPDYEEESNYYEIGYETINKQTFLFLYHFNKENKLLDKKQFSKVAETQKDNDVTAGLQQLVNKEIFAGNYTLIDSTNSKLKVVFNSDGSLVNFPGFKSYFVLTDFLGGPDNNLDQVCFNLSEPDFKCFAFEIKGNAINLYNTHSDEEKGILILDKLQYKLEKE